MATTAQNNLPAVCFAENIPDIIISDAAGKSFLSVRLNAKLIVSEAPLIPDPNGKIIIPTRLFLKGAAYYAGPSERTAVLSLLEITVKTGSGSTTWQSAILPGGAASEISDMNEFLGRNFLTWQPQQIETTPEQPQWLAVVKSGDVTKQQIRSILHANNGHTYTKIIRVETTTRFVQFNAGFRTLWAEFCRQNGLEAIAYDILGDSLDAKGNIIATNCPFAQRYILRNERYNDTCFGFINTLGGFDTLMMQGQITLKPEGEVETLINDGRERELMNEYTSFWEAATGYIDTARMASQYQDFLKSADRWIYRAGCWLRIIVDEYKIEHIPSKLNSYTFKYHLSERNERRTYVRAELPEVELPTQYLNDTTI